MDIDAPPAEKGVTSAEQSGIITSKEREEPAATGKTVSKDCSASSSPILALDFEMSVQVWGSEELFWTSIKTASKPTRGGESKKADAEIEKVDCALLLNLFSSTVLRAGATNKKLKKSDNATQSPGVLPPD